MELGFQAYRESSAPREEEDLRGRKACLGTLDPLPLNNKPGTFLAQWVKRVLKARRVLQARQESLPPLRASLGSKVCQANVDILDLKDHGESI